MPDYESGDQGSNPCSSTFWYHSCMLFKSKKVTIPTPEATTTLVAAETWSVRWNSPYGTYTHSGDFHGSKPNIEVFFNEGDANAFAQSLDNAAQLIGINGLDLKIKIDKTK